MRSRPLDWQGLVVTQYNGHRHFAWARFSCEPLALMWFQRMRSAAAIAHVPLALTVYFQGRVHRRWGDIA